MGDNHFTCLTCSPSLASRLSLVATRHVVYKTCRRIQRTHEAWFFLHGSTEATLAGTRTTARLYGRCAWAALVLLVRPGDFWGFVPWLVHYTILIDCTVLQVCELSISPPDLKIAL